MFLTLRTAVPALLLASSASTALAQQPAAAKASAPGATTIVPKAAAMVPAPSASAGASAGPARYRSAFEGYRPLTDQPVLSWRESNDLVGRIGGWQSYAREGQAGATAGATEAPASSTPEGQPAMPGHERMKMPASPTDPAKPAATRKAATAPAAASAAMPAGHTGPRQP